MSRFSVGRFVSYEEEFHQIQRALDLLRSGDDGVRVVFVIDKNGQLIGTSGDTDEIDTTSLASLTASSIAAAGGMAKVLREGSFTTQLGEGSKHCVLIQLVGERLILVVIFDSEIGLVRLRAKTAVDSLESVFAALAAKLNDLPPMTDEDIDNLFND